jgi:hypothetical protein
MMLPEASAQKLAGTAIKVVVALSKMVKTINETDRARITLRARLEIKCRGVVVEVMGSAWPEPELEFAWPEAEVEFAWSEAEVEFAWPEPEFDSPVAALPIMIGSIGSTQGASMVSNPARNDMGRRSIRIVVSFGG